jgi:hypothetical protein
MRKTGRQAMLEMWQRGALAKWLGPCLPEAQHMVIMAVWGVILNLQRHYSIQHRDWVLSYASRRQTSNTLTDVPQFPTVSKGA